MRLGTLERILHKLDYEITQNCGDWPPSDDAIRSCDAYPFQVSASKNAHDIYVMKEDFIEFRKTVNDLVDLKNEGNACYASIAVKLESSPR